ncbi:MAG: branched-chain amino acid aminotransferase [Chlamydiales bacterium]|jgi:branched-chain amino acid aminotransferase
MTNKEMNYCYFRKQIVPLEKATVNVSCQTMQYGSSCFSGIRGYYREGKVRLFRLRDHYERLMEGSKILGFDFFLEYEAFEKIIEDLVTTNTPEEDFYIRPFIFTEDDSLGPCFDTPLFDMSVYMKPLSNYYDPHKGLRMMISSWRKMSDSSISVKAKAGGSYLNSSLATTEVKRCGYDEALLMDQHGSIAEGSAANILIEYQGSIITPPLGAATLNGITMRTVVELLQSEGILVRFEPIDRSMVYTCNELILTGTAAQVSFASSVDGREMGKSAPGKPGPLCQMLRGLFNEVLDMKSPFSDKWIREFSLSAEEASVV